MGAENRLHRRFFEGVGDPDLDSHFSTRSIFTVVPAGFETPEALLQRPLIHFDWGRPTPLDITWATWARAAALKQLDVAKGIRFSEESHAIQAAIAGQGVALLSLVLIQEELKLGVLESRLTPVLDGYAYYVVSTVRATTTPAAATVETWLLEQAAT